MGNQEPYPPPAGPYPPPSQQYGSQSNAAWGGGQAYPPPQAQVYPPPGQQPYMQQGAQQPYGQQYGQQQPQPVGYGPPAMGGGPANPPYYGPPSDKYDAQQPPPGPQGAMPPTMMATNQGGMFPQKTGFRDPVFIFAFILHLVGVVVLVCIQATSEDRDDVSLDSSQVLKTAAPVIGVVIVVAAVFSLFWLALMERFPLQMIYVSMVGFILFLACTSIWAFASGNVGGGIIGLFFTVLGAIWFYLVRHMIPFSAALLHMSTALVKRYPATIAVSVAFLLVNILWLCFWGYAVIINSNKSGSIFALLYLLFSFYWTTQVLKNIVHVSVAGTMASWYFLSHTGAMPRNPTIAALKRACGKSFGSVCFGSLLIALVKMLRALVQMALRDDGMFACIVNWIMGLLDSLVELFNMYAFVHVATYGKKFMDAAKDTWAMVKEKGVDILVQNNLTGIVLLAGSVVGGLVCGAAAYLWAARLQDDGDLEFETVWALTGAAFVIGFVLVDILLNPVESTIATVFVCYAEDPATLRSANGEYFMMLEDAAAHQATRQ